MAETVFFVIGVALSVLITLFFVLENYGQRRPRPQPNDILRVMTLGYGLVACVKLWVTIAFNFQIEISTSDRFYICLGSTIVFAMLLGSLIDKFQGK